MLRDYLTLILGQQKGKAKRKAGDVRQFAVPDQHKNNFSEYFDKNLGPLLEGFEEHRIVQLLEYQKRSRIFVLVAIVAVFALLYSWVGPLNAYFNIVLFLSLFVLAVTASWSRRPIRDFKGGIKHSVYPRLVKYFGDEFEFLSRPVWTIQELSGFSILPAHDDARCEDEISGMYKGVDFRLMESRLTKVSRDSRGRRRDETVFSGLLIMLNFNKKFVGKTIVEKDHGVLGHWFKNALSGLQRVSLEDPVFERQFDVYSSDQVEARYLLTTSFMERLLLLSREFGGKNIRASFYNRQLLLMVDSKENRFEAGSIYTPVTFEHETTVFFREMSGVFDVINTLKLHETTGL